MHFRFSFFIFLTGIGISVSAQDIYQYNARSLGISASCLTISDTWSGVHNPAGLGIYPFFDIALNYSNQFMVPELSTQSIIISIPTSFGNISPSFSYYGGKLYSESHMMMAYGKMLWKWLSLGINFGYHSQRTDHTSVKESALTCQIGIIFIPANTVRIGIQILNPTRSAYGRIRGEELDSDFQTGISFSNGNSYCIALQINYPEFEKLTYSLGVECFIADYLTLRTGLKYPEILSFSFGIGLKFQRFSIDLGFEQHSILGLSSACTLAFKIKQ